MKPLVVRLHRLVYRGHRLVVRVHDFGDGRVAERVIRPPHTKELARLSRTEIRHEVRACARELRGGAP